MKPFGKIGIQIFSVIFLVFSGFYLCLGIVVVSCEIAFTVSLTYPAFLVLVLEPNRSPGCFLCLRRSVVPILL